MVCEASKTKNENNMVRITETDKESNEKCILFLFRYFKLLKICYRFL